MGKLIDSKSKVLISLRALGHNNDQGININMNKSVYLSKP